MRLSETELDDGKRSLGEWLTLSDMKTHVDRLMHRLGCDFFHQSGVEFIREAWVAADFGPKRGATEVRLIVEEPRPDIALCFSGGEIEIYEIVEADRLGRKRGDEYRAWKEAGNPIIEWPVEEWATAEQAREALRHRAEIKAKRAADLMAQGTRYPPETRLLFHLNLADFGAHTAEIEEIMPAAIEPARPWFASVWVNWKLKAYQV